VRNAQPAKLADGTVREPVRIVVGGSSASLLVTPPRTRHEEGNYGELLPRLLAEHGIVAETRHTGQWFGMIRDLRRRYESAVRNHFPDVFILNFGIAEAEPNFLPTWLARHLTSWDLSSAPIPVFYRRRIAPMMWRVLRSYQRYASRLTKNHSWRLSPNRFAREMQRVIELAREETGCLVLVLDIDPPGDRVCFWMPGMWQRWERYQGVLARLVESLDDPDVRLVPNSLTILDELGFETALPDGFHRSAVGHARTAELLTDEIVEWLGRPVEGSKSRATLSARSVERRARGQ
jgi:lysophospholipase L1-like esterase